MGELYLSRLECAHVMGPRAWYLDMSRAIIDTGIFCKCCKHISDNAFAKAFNDPRPFKRLSV
jgi:hypothetical protein